jgi:SsrA-binding protein
VERKIICQNRKAVHDYIIDETFEAGLILNGPEVKSLRDGKANLTDSYARIKKGEAYLYNMHITPYPFAHHMKLDPDRTRKLLLHKMEIKRLTAKTEERGFTMVPLKVYFSKGWVKVEVALVKGKRKVDKRQAIKERDMKREMDRARKKGEY